MEWFIAFLLAIYPCELSESDMGLPARGARPALASDHGKPGLEAKAIGPVDKKLFLRSFSAQAGPELMPCLRQIVGATGSLAFLGRLHRSGSLTGVRLVLARKIDGDCAARAIEKMAFTEVAQSLRDESVEINWRFDW